MMEINTLLRPHIKNLTPYTTARDEYRGTHGIFLDANENALGSVSGQGLNRYPSSQLKKLKNKIAEKYGQDGERIFLGNGSDEAIDLLFRAFCRPGEDEIILSPPTYGMYKVLADINHVRIREVPMTRDFSIRPDEIIASTRANTKIIFFCSPNNPTGNSLDAGAMTRVIGQFSGLVVIDGAYADFCDGFDWISAIKEYKNLVVLRTFSKAWGLANIRLGMAFGHPDIIKVLNRIKLPYNINGLTADAAIEALDMVSKKEQMVKTLLAERNKLTVSLRQMTAVRKVFPSDANFLLVRFNDSKKIYKSLMSMGLIVRDRSHQLYCENCLRITVGSPEENEILVHALTSIKGEK